MIILQYSVAAYLLAKLDVQTNSGSLEMASHAILDDWLRFDFLLYLNCLSRSDSKRVSLVTAI